MTEIWTQAALWLGEYIVVGHRGHPLFERWLIGSVARQVIAYLPRAVTVVRRTAP
jgi:nucleotide-binding universal stress UspA family protein